MLVAREFQERTESAFEFLIENGLPVKLIRVTVYEDNDGRRVVDVEGEHEPGVVLGAGEEKQWPDHTKIAGRAMKVSDLLEHGLVQPGDKLTWTRPQKGTSYEATITDNGAIQIQGGGTYSSPSRAAMEAADIPSYDGWYAWKVERVGKTLNDLRHELKAQLDAGAQADAGE